MWTFVVILCSILLVVCLVLSGCVIALMKDQKILRDSLGHLSGRSEEQSIIVDLHDPEQRRIDHGREIIETEELPLATVVQALAQQYPWRYSRNFDYKGGKRMPDWQIVLPEKKKKVSSTRTSA